MAEKLLGSAIQSGTITSTQLTNELSTNISQGGGPKITSLTYPGDDTAANTAGGQTIIINGTGFQNNVQVYINGNAVPSVTYSNSNSVSFTTPALSASSHILYLTNTDDGGTAILVPGLQVSGEPTWNTAATLTAQDVDNTWNISLLATSDSSVTYALAEGSSLPSGISLAANGLISGTLSSPPEDDTTYNFTVIASDAENQDASRAFSVNVTTGEGVLFANTVLLLHGDGTNNQNNNVFLDSSNNNFTITRNGNPTQGSFSPFSQTGWSGYFDGTGDYLTFTKQTTTGSFTCECWFYPTANAGGYHILFSGSNLSNPNADNVQLLVNNSGGVGLNLNGTVVISATGTSVIKNQWNHIAYVRSDSSCAIFVNGSRIATGTSSAALNVVSIGSYLAGYLPIGYISNARITTTAVYDVTQTTYVVPTSPLTAVGGTYLLTLQDNRIVDKSANPLTLTINGDVSVQPYSPFAPTAKYSTANVGGSGYFDGTGDYLTTPNNSNLNFGSSNFTIEGWYYVFATSELTLVERRGTAFVSGDWGIFVVNGGIDFFGYDIISSGNTILTSGSRAINQWNHFAIVRNGSTFTLYINGVSTSTYTSSSSFADNSLGLTIGRDNPNGGRFYFNGYISGLRFVNGSALYASNFTPPSAPVTNIANTSLLLNFTNAGIFDSTAKNVLETVGDAKVSTAQYKYGTGSILLTPGNGSHYTRIPLTNSLKFGTGDFTVECWIYLITNAAGICAVWSNYNSFSAGSLSLFAGHSSASTNNFYIAHNGVFPALSSSTTVNSRLNLWTHLAVVRNSEQIKLYINGVSEGTPFASTVALNGVGSYFWVGSTGDSPAGNPNCYIDDFRISRFARYTSNFTPPTSAFKDR